MGAAARDACALHPGRRWIHERLVGNKSSTKRLETKLLLEGRLLVEGPPRDGRPLYGPEELRADVQDLSRGQRCVLFDTPPSWILAALCPEAGATATCVSLLDPRWIRASPSVGRRAAAGAFTRRLVPRADATAHKLSCALSGRA